MESSGEKAQGRKSSCCFIGQAGQGFTGYTVNGPIVHWDGAKVLIELNRGLIPIENGPFETAAAAITREAGQVHEKGFAETAAPHFRDYKQILEVKAGTAEEGGEIVKEEGEPNGPVLKIADDRLSDSPRAEQRFAQHVVRDDALIGQFLVLCELSNEGHQGCDVAFGRSANLKIAHQPSPITRKRR